jgi:hypothetical protein
MSERRRVVEVAPPPAEEPAPGSSPRPPAADEVARVERFLRRLARERFYGSIVVSMQGGRVTVVKTEQAMKIDEL